MKILIVDDDFTTRKLLMKHLLKYGYFDVAVNGKEAVEAFKIALAEKEPYDLICLDIMMPEMNGHETLKQIRKIEKENGKTGLDGTKIVMTTILEDIDNVKVAFREQCEAYLVKPIEKQKLIQKLKELNLIKTSE